MTRRRPGTLDEGWLVVFRPGGMGLPGPGYLAKGTGFLMRSNAPRSEAIVFKLASQADRIAQALGGEAVPDTFTSTINTKGEPST